MSEAQPPNSDGFSQPTYSQPEPAQAYSPPPPTGTVAPHPVAGVPTADRIRDAAAGSPPPPPTGYATQQQGFPPPPGYATQQQGFPSPPGYAMQQGSPPPPPPDYVPPPAGSVYHPQQAWNAPFASSSPYNAPQVEEKVPPVAWLVPVAALLAVIGVFTPWFKPNADVKGPSGSAHLVGDSLYSWKDGRIGLLAPVVLVVLAVGVVGLLRGRTSARFTRGTTSPIVSAARGVIIAGVVSMVCLVIAYFLLPGRYKIDIGAGKMSWDDARNYVKAHGGTLSISHGQQVGFWLTLAAAVLAVVAGVAMLLMRGRQAPSLTK